MSIFEFDSMPPTPANTHLTTRLEFFINDVSNLKTAEDPAYIAGKLAAAQLFAYGVRDQDDANTIVDAALLEDTDFNPRSIVGILFDRGFDDMTERLMAKEGVTA